MNIAEAILWKYPTASPLSDFIVRDDENGKGPYLYAWNLPDPKPSQDDLNSWYVEAVRDAQLNLLSAAWTQSVQTFQSNATGTLYTYSNDDIASSRYNAIYTRFQTDSTYTSENILTHEAGFVNHTKAQFQQVWMDGYTYEQAQASTFDQKSTSVKAIQLSSYSSVDACVSAIQAVTW